jgi:hypothetical protein
MSQSFSRMRPYRVQMTPPEGSADGDRAPDDITPHGHVSSNADGNVAVVLAAFASTQLPDAVLLDAHVMPPVSGNEEGAPDLPQLPAGHTHEVGPSVAPFHAPGLPVHDSPPHVSCRTLTPISRWSCRKSQPLLLLTTTMKSQPLLVLTTTMLLLLRFFFLTQPLLVSSC